MTVQEILDQTKDGARLDQWYKLLDVSQAKDHCERIVADEEAEKVRVWINRSAIMTLGAVLLIDRYASMIFDFYITTYQ